MELRMQAVDRLLEALAPSLSTERSEEHTSELQSQSNVVCRLLLDTKNPVFCATSRRALHCSQPDSMTSNHLCRTLRRSAPSRGDSSWPPHLPVSGRSASREQPSSP